MSKRRTVTKLFAVALGLAGCEEATPAPAVASPSPTAAPGVAKPPAAPVPAAVAPRTLPNGRPACGNVMGKAPLPPECEKTIADYEKFCFVHETRTCVAGTEADRAEWQRWQALTGMAVKPRTLPDGTPAPGNVASRAKFAPEKR
jgi:hypothetical protein